MYAALPKPAKPVDLLTPAPVRDDNGVLWCGQCREHVIGNDALRQGAVCPSCKDRVELAK